LAAQLESEAAQAGDAAKVRTLADVVKQLETEPNLAQQ
jgi:hypothetical protein